MKKQKKVLPESELYFRMLFDQSPIGLALTRMNGELVDVNNTFAQIIGRSIDDTLKLSYWDITPEKYADQEQMQLNLLNTIGRYGPYEKEYIHKNGKLIPVRLQGLIIEQKGEKFIWSSIENISERIRAERAIRKSEENYRYLFENNPHSMWIYDLETLAFLEVNKSAIVNYGYTREEFLKLTIEDIRPIEDLPALKKDIEQTSDDINNAGIWRHIKKYGEIIYVEIISSLIDFRNKKARLVIASDVTKRHEAELSLKQSEAKYSAFFENSLDAILLTSPDDGYIYAANPAACKMFGRTESDICTIGRNGLTDLSDPRIPILIRERKEKGKAYGEINMVRKDGSIFPVEVSSAIFSIAEGNKMTSMIIRDITERKRTEQLIKKLNVELEQKVAERTRDLEAKIAEIEKMNKLFIDRELRMIELKKRLKATEAQLKNKNEI